MNFDKGVADRLIGACRDAARTLQDQRGGRESISTAALEEFRGAFGDCFRENVATERAARSELVHMLEDVARQAHPFTGNGVVWGGNNPVYRDEFEQYFYRGPDDDKINGAINSVEEGNILMDNHSLIAFDSGDNMKALENMAEIVTR